MPASDGPRETVDLVVSGGRVLTMAGGVEDASVLVVDAGRVVASGKASLAERYEPRETLRLDGRVVLPGLVDAHAHFLALGRLKDQIDLRDAASFDEVVALVAREAASRPEGSPILGRGWNHERWPGSVMPTHDALSEATPRHPVLLRRVDGHAILANARAMEESGVTQSAEAPPGGEILRDREGRPTGLFVDAACALLRPAPRDGGVGAEERALAAQAACLSAGLTCVHDAGADEEALQVYERLASDGSLVLRVNAMLEGDFDADDEPRPWLAARLARGPVDGASGGRLTMRAVKIYLDGALGSHGAALLAPYADRPGSRGLLQLSPHQLERRVRACRDAGFQAAVHAIGDAANRLVLDVFERVLSDARGTDHRFRIEHAQIVGDADFARFGALGVVASVQPTHATSDWRMAAQRLGRERLAGAYAWRRLLDGGARLALGSDFPVEPENPFHGLFAACERVDAAGEPEGGFMASQRLSREEALRGFTSDAAFAGFDEDRLGSLAPGRFADFLVVAADPLTCAAPTLRATTPEETWISGRRVFARAAAAAAGASA